MCLPFAVLVRCRIPQNSCAAHQLIGAPEVSGPRNMRCDAHPLQKFLQKSHPASHRLSRCSISSICSAAAGAVQVPCAAAAALSITESAEAAAAFAMEAAQNQNLGSISYAAAVLQKHKQFCSINSSCVVTTVVVGEWLCNSSSSLCSSLLQYQK